jgi:hypothetical protein
MTNEEKIFNTLRAMAVMKGYDVTTERLEMMTMALAEFEGAEVEKACKKILFKSKFFPDISEIYNAMNEDDLDANDHAQVAVFKVLKAVEDHGYMGSTRAQIDLGELWNVVLMFGGWKAICAYPGENLGTLRAQLRDIAKTYCNKTDSVKKEISSTPKLFLVKDDPQGLSELDIPKMQMFLDSLEKDGKY